MDKKQLHNRVKTILYSLTGITLAENKDIMITNRLEKLKRNTNFSGDINQLLDILTDVKQKQLTGGDPITGVICLYFSTLL